MIGFPSYISFEEIIIIIIIIIIFKHPNPFQIPVS